MPTDYRESHLAPDKGQSYHAEFSTKPYRNMVWQFEKDILDRILSTLFAKGPVEHLDFACGTGRILTHLESKVQTSVGVDLSPSMLEVARTNRQRAELIEADLTKDDVLGPRKFNLITAFRFFPNAEPSLRLQVMRILASHLREDGFIVFNNHKHTGSSRNRLARLLGHRSFQGMSMADVDELLARNNLKAANIYPLCIFPSSEERMLLPRFCLRPIEAALSNWSCFQGFGENLIYVCRRSDSKAPGKE